MNEIEITIDEYQQDYDDVYPRESDDEQREETDIQFE